MLCFAGITGALAAACGPEEAEIDACTQTSIEVYQRRIEPLLLADQPSSCNECHLSGVDLGVLVQGSPCETMACLVERQLVDLDAPAQSQVLGWIERAAPQSDLITQEVIQAEYDALYAWIEAVASCGACADARCSNEPADTFCDVEVEPAENYDPEADPGGCSDRDIEQLFLDTVYTFRGRCYPCHYESADSPPVGATPWIVEQDNCHASSLATLRNVLEANLIDSDEPLQSRLLLKPLAEEDGGVEHGGHDKFTIDGDPAYTNLVYFLTRYAACQGND
jgi:hypothetical protein